MLKNFMKYIFCVIIAGCVCSGVCSAANNEIFDQEICLPVNSYFFVDVPAVTYEFDHAFAEQVTVENKEKLLFKNTGDTVLKVLYPVCFNPPICERLCFLVHVVTQDNLGSAGWEEQVDNDLLTNEEIANFDVKILELVNIERAKVGAKPLRLADDLQKGAYIRVQELTQVFSHERPNGEKCFTVLGKRQNKGLGENIAAGSRTPEDVMKGWMESPGHRSNILNKSFRELGVGYCYDLYGVGGYRHYWVQIFRG